MVGHQKSFPAYVWVTAILRNHCGVSRTRVYVVSRLAGGEITSPYVTMDLQMYSVPVVIRVELSDVRISLFTQLPLLGQTVGVASNLYTNEDISRGDCAQFEVGIVMSNIHVNTIRGGATHTAYHANGG